MLRIAQEITLRHRAIQVLFQRAENERNLKKLCQDYPHHEITINKYISGDFTIDEFIDAIRCK